MNIEKQIIDQRINKIIQDNADLFTEEDLEKNVQRPFCCWAWLLIWT